MAGRPMKEGLDYFELDCHMEDKVKLIQAEFGLKGFAVVVKLYQKIYGGFGYYCEWSEDSLLLFMSENGIPSDSKNLIQEIVSACIRRNIFSEQLFNKFNILTSEGVQKRYLNATSKREKIELKKEYLLIVVPENNKNVVINSIFDGRNSINDGRNSQSRVEKSKEKESRVEKRKEEKHRHGDYAHVLLTDMELSKLFQDYGESETLEAIKFLDEYIEMKSYKAKNHSLALRKWVFRAVQEEKEKEKRGYGRNQIQGDRDILNEWRNS